MIRKMDANVVKTYQKFNIVLAEMDWRLAVPDEREE